MSSIAKQAAVLANVASSATSVTLFAANAGAKTRTVFNDSTAVLYIALSATAASTTAFTVSIQAAGYYEVPGVYGGAVTAIWASANGFARTTEY